MNNPHPLINQLASGQRWRLVILPGEGVHDFDFTLGKQLNDTTWQILCCDAKGLTAAFKSWWANQDHIMILLCTKDHAHGF